MPIESAAVAVGVTATLLADATNTSDLDHRRVTVRNVGANDVFLGGLGVTTTNGLTLPTATTVSFELGPGDALYGVVAAATENVRVLRQRR